MDTFTKPDDFTNHNVWRHLPPELFVKILHFVRPRKVGDFRLVCRQWKDVVDENFDIKVKINDEKIDPRYIKQFSRVTHCKVYSFTKESKNCDLFRDTKSLTNLIIQNNITRENFLGILKQCENINKLTVTGFILATDFKIFDTTSAEETAVLLKFFGSLKTLVISSVLTDFAKAKHVLKNLNDIFDLKTPQLKNLVLRVYWLEPQIEHKLFRFLGQCSSLEGLDITMRELRRHPLTCIQEFCPYKFRLTSLKIEYTAQNEFQDWFPILLSQFSLKHLHLNNILGMSLDDEIEKLVSKNRNTLITLELHGFCKRGIDLGKIQWLRKLETLILKGETSDYLLISNVKKLPVSVQNFQLENVRCVTRDLEEVSNRIPNTKFKNIN